MSNIAKKVIKTSKLCLSINTSMVSSSELFMALSIWVCKLNRTLFRISFGLTNPWTSTKPWARLNSIRLIIIKGGGYSRQVFSCSTLTDNNNQNCWSKQIIRFRRCQGDGLGPIFARRVNHLVRLKQSMNGIRVNRESWRGRSCVVCFRRLRKTREMSVLSVIANFRWWEFMSVWCLLWFYLIKRLRRNNSRSEFILSRLRVRTVSWVQQIHSLLKTASSMT